MTADEIQALRAATREAHEALQDLRAERRRVEQLLTQVDDRVKRAVTSLIEEAVKRDLAELGQVTHKAMHDAVAKVCREFDRLARIYLGRDADGTETLEELTRRAATRSGW